MEIISIFSFEFWIIAADSVHSERAKVSILVLDENDNEPDVFVAFTKPHLSIPNSGLYLIKCLRLKPSGFNYSGFLFEEIGRNIEYFEYFERWINSVFRLG